ncbi:right-handed parallel beta-helix repeat-containing protein [Halorarum halobium]|uniref:right-handed parallel beta-helix repeat-containing protein n=1 Tax=Halorarum halobium TaxID=3075121 RepID=UPI0028A646E0|nr:right-handed parallel beta-helix repeat-containing protein [Halobaculum sp. XH14]
MKRRTLLTAAAGVTAGLAGCGEAVPGEWPAATPGGNPQLDAIADAWGFDEFVDLEAEVEGPLADRELGGVLEAVAGDGRMLYLPPGRYRLADSWAFSSFSKFGLVADNATVVPPKGFRKPLFRLGDPGSASQLLVSGLEFDFREPDTGGRPIAARVDDKLVLRDVTVTGRQDVESDGVRVDVASPDGTGLVERLRMPDGSVGEWSNTGCEVGDDTRGDVSFVDCRIEGFPDNGLYANPPEGRVRVLGGYYANNGVASVRVNAGPGSVVRGVHVRCDDSPDGFENMRGIRLRGGRDVLIDKCLVEMLDVTSSDGAVTFASEQESATMRDTRIRVDADGVNAIRIKSPTDVVFARRGSFHIEDVVITGEAATGSAIYASHRDDCRFSGLCVHQPGTERGGVQAIRVNGSISDTYLAVTNAPYQFRNSNIDISDVSVDRLTAGGDRLPNAGCK